MVRFDIQNTGEFLCRFHVSLEEYGYIQIFYVLQSLLFPFLHLLGLLFLFFHAFFQEEFSKWKKRKESVCVQETPNGQEKKENVILREGRE